MDPCTIALVVGQRGSGKTSLIRALALRERRVIRWDTKGEHDGQRITFRDIPALFRRRAFDVVYYPVYARNMADLSREFEALATLLYRVGRSFTLTIDELQTVCPKYQEGGLGMLLRFSREKRINFLYATQRIAGIPGVCISEAHTLYCFHLHSRADLQILGAYVDQDQARRVRALPAHEYESITL